ncbi:MAG: GTP-binding protein [Nitrospiraceae bacterium]|nr:GTP-binding protein [Nitrospiraceae bacterium]
MVDYLSKIEELKKELSTTKRNKRTEHHIGLVKAKLAQLVNKQEKRSKSGASGKGYFVRRVGDASVILIGTPSCGKSTLINDLTGIHSEVGRYAFTTLTIIPGMMKYKHAEIMILDVPGIISGASLGRGRGKEVLSTVRNSDLCLILVDATRTKDYDVVLRELYNSAVRLNQRPPDIKIKKKSRGGISISKTVKLTKITKDTIKAILSEFKMMNVDVLIREDIDDDQLIDVIQGNRKYLPSITVVNKIDLVSKKEIEKINDEIRPDLMISAKDKKNIDALKELIYQKLNFMNIYTKEPNKKADLEIPLVVKKNSTVRDVCNKLHKDMVRKFRFARIWGKSAKFDAQKVMLKHVLQDGDIIEIHTF